MFLMWYKSSKELLSSLTLKSLMTTHPIHGIYKDSERRFQHVLEACGVNKPIWSQGRILIGLSNVKKLSFDPTKWSGNEYANLYVDLFLSLCGIYPSNDHWKELAEQEFRHWMDYPPLVSWIK
ncbi:hypothetical protein NC651_021386 [Populus alba x Populus x berolinensis]|nr:hypothetical protein NC651_021386 [Populus alba x Populus x berolinensis]